MHYCSIGRVQKHRCMQRHRDTRGTEGPYLHCRQCTELQSCRFNLPFLPSVSLLLSFEFPRFFSALIDHRRLAYQGESMTVNHSVNLNLHYSYLRDFKIRHTIR